MCVCCDHVPGLVSVPHASPPLLARPREAPSLPELRLCASSAHRGLRLHTGTLESTSGVCVSVCECEGVCASVPECVRVCLYPGQPRSVRDGPVGRLEPGLELIDIHVHWNLSALLLRVVLLARWYMCF